MADAVGSGLVPAAVLEVGSSAGVTHRSAEGTSEDAIFDLASLTKVLATALVAMRLVEDARLDLDWPVRRVLPEWGRPDRASVTIRDLLSHASGLPAHRPFHLHCSGADAVVLACVETALDAPPRTRACYSDLGFIVLGRALERLAGATLDTLADHVFARVSGDPPRFTGRWAGRVVVPTGWSDWRARELTGEVHDDTAAAMGGVAGHAGLFGSAAGVGDVARTVLRGLRRHETPLARPDIVAAFARRSPVPGSSRALGWDTALPTSSCGRHLSPKAIGHTGFTGTSVWIDPVADLYVVLLTNRVAGTASADDITALRRDVHEAIGAAHPEAVR